MSIFSWAGEHYPEIRNELPGRGYVANEFAAGCPECDYWTPQCATEAEAIAAWNTRPPAPEEQREQAFLAGVKAGREQMAAEIGPYMKVDPTVISPQSGGISVSFAMRSIARPSSYSHEKERP